MAGWVKLHRTITDSFVFQNPDRLKFWVWCLCKASHRERKQNVGLQEVDLKKGQFIFGRKKASSELSMDESKIYRLLKTFENRNKIEVKSNNKFSVVTIVNWTFYQGEEQQSEQQTNNKLTTNQQQSNTNKNVKKVKNVNKEYTDDFIEMYSKYPRPENKRQTFTNYSKLLKEYTHDQLMTCVDNYIIKVKADGTDKTFMKVSSNFFGKQAIFEDYLIKNKTTEPKSKLKVMDLSKYEVTYAE